MLITSDLSRYVWTFWRAMKMHDYVLRLYNKSSEAMMELADDEVALTVTSPPYWNAIDYDVHSKKGNNEWYRTRKYAVGFEGYNDYLAFIERVYREVFRATKPGGFACTVVGTILHDKSHIPLPFHFSQVLCDIGWEFHQDIIWHKCTAGVKRAGSVIQKRLPGYFYPNIMTEYILVHRKPGEPIYRTASHEAKVKSKIEINKLFVTDTANNIWHVAPVPPGVIDHPCPFPEEIPLRLITLYSHVGDVVLDPFVGSGQTAKVAIALNRHAVGYDVQSKYVDMTKERVHEPLAVRPQQLIAQFERIHINAPLENKYTGLKRTRPRQLKLLDVDPNMRLFKE